MFEHDTVISQQGIKYGFSLDSWVFFLFYIWRLDLSPCFKVCGIFFSFHFGYSQILCNCVQLKSVSEDTKWELLHCCALRLVPIVLLNFQTSWNSVSFSGQSSFSLAARVMEVIMWISIWHSFTELEKCGWDVCGTQTSWYSCIFQHLLYRYRFIPAAEFQGILLQFLLKISISKCLRNQTENNGITLGLQLAALHKIHNIPSVQEKKRRDINYLILTMSRNVMHAFTMK